MQPSKFGHMGHIGKNVLLWPADLKLQGFGQIDLALPRPGQWWRCECGSPVFGMSWDPRLWRRMVHIQLGEHYCSGLCKKV